MDDKLTVEVEVPEPQDRYFIIFLQVCRKLSLPPYPDYYLCILNLPREKFTLTLFVPLFSNFRTSLETKKNVILLCTLLQAARCTSFTVGTMKLRFKCCLLLVELVFSGFHSNSPYIVGFLYGTAKYYLFHHSCRFFLLCLISPESLITRLLRSSAS